jgi:hypothetical protein
MISAVLKEIIQIFERQDFLGLVALEDIIADDFGA